MDWVANLLTAAWQVAVNGFWWFVHWTADMWWALVDYCFSFASALIPDSVRVLLNTETVESMRSVWGAVTWMLPVYPMFAVISVAFVGVGVIRLVRWAIAFIPFLNL